MGGSNDVVRGVTGWHCNTCGVGDSGTCYGFAMLNVVAFAVGFLVGLGRIFFMQVFSLQQSTFH